MPKTDAIDAVGLIDPIDAVQELDRLPDWGRGSFGEFATRQRWLQRVRDGGLWESVVVVIAAPQAILVALGSVPAGMELIVLAGSALPVCYLIATVLAAPELPPFTYWLWLFSKVAATTMTSVAVAALLIAGPFGLIVAAPALVVAAVSAIGTALVRRGLSSGSVFTIAIFAILGFACRGWFFQLPAENDAVHAVEISAFSVAAIAALLALASAAGARTARRREARRSAA